MKKKIKLLTLLIALIFVCLFIFSWNLVKDGYDKQDKFILLLKKIIPSNTYKYIRDTILIIPNLKAINKDLVLQVKKYEQGLQGNFFEKKKINFLKKELEFTNYFLPFQRLDVRAGYQSIESTFRAHYLEIVDDKVIVISGQGKTLYFEKKNIFKNKLDQKYISNNIEQLMLNQEQEFFGIRDLFYYKEKLYISLIFKDKKGYSIDIYSSSINFENLNFEKFFSTKEYFQTWSVSTGGRLEKFDEDNIIVSLGFANVKGSPQNDKSLLGKIFSINLKTKNIKILSKGHRNPQGLFYDSKLNLIINTEHGPKGGDEINFNYLNLGKIPNFGFDIVSLGVKYDGSDPYLRPHAKYGYDEPFKFYDPSIGISEIIFLKNNIFTNKNIFIVSSLRAASLYILELNDDLTKIENEERINFGNERIRDLKFDIENNCFFILFEMTPSIGVLKLAN